MKIFIWKGNGISDAYYDDGTLVVLANTAEEAREIMRADRNDKETQKRLREEELNQAAKDAGFSEPYYWRQADLEAMKAKMDEVDSKYPRASEYSETWDGAVTSIDREPDEIVELDKPKFVAFNGGGYD